MHNWVEGTFDLRDWGKGQRGAHGSRRQRPRGTALGFSVEKCLRQIEMHSGTTLAPLNPMKRKFLTWTYLSATLAIPLIPLLVLFKNYSLRLSSEFCESLL